MAGDRDRRVGRRADAGAGARDARLRAPSRAPGDRDDRGDPDRHLLHRPALERRRAHHPRRRLDVPRGGHRGRPAARIRAQHRARGLRGAREPAVPAGRGVVDPARVAHGPARDAAGGGDTAPEPPPFARGHPQGRVPARPGRGPLRDSESRQDAAPAVQGCRREAQDGRGARRGAASGDRPGGVRPPREHARRPHARPPARRHPPAPARSLARRPVPDDRRRRRRQHRPVPLRDVRPRPRRRREGPPRLHPDADRQAGALAPRRADHRGQRARGPAGLHRARPVELGGGLAGAPAADGARGRQPRARQRFPESRARARVPDHERRARAGEHQHVPLVGGVREVPGRARGVADLRGPERRAGSRRADRGDPGLPGRHRRGPHLRPGALPAGARAPEGPPAARRGRSPPEQPQGEPRLRAGPRRARVGALRPREPGRGAVPRSLRAGGQDAAAGEDRSGGGRRVAGQRGRRGAANPDARGGPDPLAVGALAERVRLAARPRGLVGGPLPLRLRARRAGAGLGFRARVRAVDLADGGRPAPAPCRLLPLSASGSVLRRAPQRA